MQTRTLLLIVVVGIGGGRSLVAQNSEILKSPDELHRAIAGVQWSSKPSEAEIRTSLNETTEIEFIDTPLSEAMAFVRDLHAIPIILEVNALQEEGILPDEPINLQLSGISLRSALKIMLEPIGVTYVIEDEVLKITSQTAADEKMQVRIYDVAALVPDGGETRSVEELVSRIIAPASWDSQGGLGAIDSHGTLLIVRQNFSVHRQISGFLEELIRAAAKK